MAKKNSFEASLETLEKIVEKLDDGGVSLEDAIKMFEDGRKHAKVCEAKLNEVERRIQVLLESPDGQPQLRDFEGQAAEAEPSKDDFPG